MFQNGAMKFIDVKCINRETSVSININHIVLLNKITIAASGKEACQIVLTSVNDGKGPVEVVKSVSNIKKQIAAAK